MPEQSQFVMGYHSCDKNVGIKVLNGKDDLIASSNSWDWLGDGIYFWENDPLHALTYSKESSNKKQFNKIPIKTPFVLGAIIQLGNCLNLVESESLQILSAAYSGFKKVIEEAGESFLKIKEIIGPWIARLYNIFISQIRLRE